MTKGGLVLATLVCALAAVASGCGGGGTSTAVSRSSPPAHHPLPVKPARHQKYSRYEREMQVLGAQLAAELAASGRAVGVPTAKRTAIARVLRDTQVELRTAAARLTKIKPPARIEAKHRRLIAALREFAAELSGVIAGVERGNGAPVYALVPNLKGLKDMRRASDAITNAGYVIVTR